MIFFIFGFDATSTHVQLFSWIRAWWLTSLESKEQEESSWLQEMTLTHSDRHRIVTVACSVSRSLWPSVNHRVSVTCMTQWVQIRLKFSVIWRMLRVVILTRSSLHYTFVWLFVCFLLYIYLTLLSKVTYSKCIQQWGYDQKLHCRNHESKSQLIKYSELLAEVGYYIWKH